jgi:hypothetical protein
MVTLTEAIERILTVCEAGTYNAPAPTNSCRPLQTALSLFQETQDTGRYRKLFTRHSFVSREWLSHCAEGVTAADETATSKVSHGNFTVRARIRSWGSPGLG